MFKRTWCLKKYICDHQKGCNRVILEIYKVIFGLSVPHGNQTLFCFCLKFGIYCVVYFLFNSDLFLVLKDFIFPLAEGHIQPHKAVGIFNIEKKRRKKKRKKWQKNKTNYNKNGMLLWLFFYIYKKTILFCTIWLWMKTSVV